MSEYYAVSERDKGILRNFAKRIAKIGSDPIMNERRRLWKKINALDMERPVIMVETWGAIDEIIPVDTLTCEGEWARGMERGLLDKIFWYEQLRDDVVITPRITYGNCVTSTDYGVVEARHWGDNNGALSSFTWDPPLKDLPADLDKLHFREHTLDEATTQRQKALLEDIFEGILPVEKRSAYWWSQGLTMAAVFLLGLEQLMLAMYDQPEGLHALMAFLRDDQMRMLDWFEGNGLLTLNNEDDYVSSGSRGHTDLLPQSDYVPGSPARIKDLWGLSESQETVGVSPELFEEFVFQYQAPIISRFGFACYGCCEPVDSRWHVIKKIPNLRRVSVSPWANVEKMAANLGGDYIFSRKPNPAYVSTGKWDEDLIRADLRRTLQATKGLNVELILKDVHTVNHEPWRLGRWVEIAREEIDEVYGG